MGIVYRSIRFRRHLRNGRLGQACKSADLRINKTYLARGWLAPVVEKLEKREHVKEHRAPDHQPRLAVRHRVIGFDRPPLLRQEAWMRFDHDLDLLVPRRV